MASLTKQEWMEILKRDGGKFKLIEGELKNDHDLIITALNSTLVALQYVDKSLAGDKEFILRAIKETPWAIFIYKFANEKVKGEEEVLREALLKDGEVIAYADKRFQNWLDLAFVALRAEKNASIKYFGESLRGNREIMEEVVRRHPNEMIYIAENLRRDIPFLARVGRRNKKLLEVMDKDIVEDVKECIFEMYNSVPERF